MSERHTVVVTVEQRFDRTADGRCWAPEVFGDTFWRRYLRVFDRVTVLARLRDVTQPSPGFRACAVPEVTFVRLPYYLGPSQFLLKAPAVCSRAAAAIRSGDSVILRIPSPIACCVASHLRRHKHPYAVEVVGDPHEVFSRHASRHPFRHLFRWWLTKEQKRQCLDAASAAYVTEWTLQSRYPARGPSVAISDANLGGIQPRALPFTTHYSSSLDNEIVKKTREYVTRPDPLRLITVASLAQRYKGIDVLLKAIATNVRAGLDVHLVVVGDGKYLLTLKRYADSLGLAQRVTFRGFLSRDTVTAELDAADVFVLPSWTEGLPRALIEAMARGLPCICSDVGGIPELLPREDLVKAGDHEGLAAKITLIATDPARLCRMSHRNLNRARDFDSLSLEQRRLEFYEHVRQRTEAWFGGCGA